MKLRRHLAETAVLRSGHRSPDQNGSLLNHGPALESLKRVSPLTVRCYDEGTKSR